MTPLTAMKTLLVLAGALGLVAACGSSGPTPDATPCDQKCTDGTALRGMRETMKRFAELRDAGRLDTSDIDVELKQ